MIKIKKKIVEKNDSQEVFENLSSDQRIYNKV